MSICTAIRVGLHTRADGSVLSMYRCFLGPDHVMATESDAELVRFVRASLNTDRTTNRNLLLNCLDNLDYSIERA